MKNCLDNLSNMFLTTYDFNKTDSVIANRTIINDNEKEIDKLMVIVNNARKEIKEAKDKCSLIEAETLRQNLDIFEKDVLDNFKKMHPQLLSCMTDELKDSIVEFKKAFSQLYSLYYFNDKI